MAVSPAAPSPKPSYNALSYSQQPCRHSRCCLPPASSSLHYRIRNKVHTDPVQQQYLQSTLLTVRRYAKRGICRRRVSVCVSVTLRYCIKMAKRRIMQIMPHDRFVALVYTDKHVARSLCRSRATCCTQVGYIKWY